LQQEKAKKRKLYR